MSGSSPLSSRQSLDASDHGKGSYGYIGQDVFRGTQASQMAQLGQQRDPPLRAYAPDPIPQLPYSPYRMEDMPPAPYSTPNKPPIREASEFSSSKQQRKTKGNVASACGPCKRAHLRCDAQRPCSRCLSNGKEDICVDVQHKKRGRPKLRDGNQARYEGARPGSPPPDVSVRRPLSFSPSDTQIAHSSADPLHRSSSYRVLKSPGGLGPRSSPTAPRYSDHALAADANISGGSRVLQSQEPFCAYLTMEMQVAKATASLSEIIGLPSIISRRFQEIVSSNDCDKVARLQRDLESERREREPNYLPPIHLLKFEEDRVIQSVGFSLEEISGVILNRQEMFTFLGINGQQRAFQVRFGLAQKERTYFIVLMLQIPATPQTYNPSVFSREPYSQDSQSRYQTPQQNYPPTQAPSPFVSNPGFGDPHAEMGTFRTPGPLGRPISQSISIPSFAQSQMRQEYPQGQASYPTPRGGLPQGQSQHQHDLQLPPIRDQRGEGSSMGMDQMRRRENRSGRVDIGGLLERSDQGRDQRSSLPDIRQSSAREDRYGYQGPLSELTAFVSKSSQRDFDAASPSTSKITTELLKSPSSMPPMEGSHSHTNISSGYDDETDWGEKELSPSPQDIYPGNLSDGGKIFEERNLSPTKRKLVEDIMEEFRLFLAKRKKATGEGNFQGNSPSQDGASQQKPASSEFSTKLQPSGQGRQADRNEGKRRRDSQGSQNDDDRDDRNRKRPRPLLFPPMKDDDNTKFACPYRKHDPQKYCVQYWRSCALTPLETVARVKEHLYKHHRIFPCQRCKVLFQDQQEVNQHLKEPKGCELVETDQADGVTSEIVEKLRSRKKAYKGQTEEERWEEIYKLLFPDEIAPSPYYEPVQEDMQSPDSRALAEYEQYCRRELPRYFRASLEEMIDKEAQPFEENIRSQLMSMIRDCQDRVFSTYRATATSALQRSTMNNSKSPPLAVRSSTSQDMRYGSSEPTEDREHSSEMLFPAFLEPPAPQSHLTSRLESTNSDGQTPPPAENNLSDSGYISDIRPLLSAENSSQNVVVSTSQPSQSHPASEELCTQRPSSQHSSSFETTAPDIQRSHNFFNNSGDVRNTPGNSWMGDFDPSMMLVGDEWSQFVGMDPTLDPPA